MSTTKVESENTKRQRSKALAAASSAPIRRRAIPAPPLKDGGEPRWTYEWSSGLVGKLNPHACTWLEAEGHIAPDLSDESGARAYVLTPKGTRRLASERAADRAWLR